VGRQRRRVRLCEGRAGKQGERTARK
jgi:hypothetical protein